MAEDLVEIIHKQAITTSLKVAEVFGKRHDRVIRAIEDAMVSLPKNGDTSKAFVISSYVDTQGKNRPMYYLNRDGFAFVVMGFNNTPKVAEWKWKYIQAFNAMEQRLIELEIQRQNEEWRAARKLTKIELRELTDTIKERLIPLMIEQGASDNAIKWVYKNYVSMIQKLLGIKTGTRNELPLDLLYELGKVEQMAKIIIKGLVVARPPHKQIYSNTKSKLDSYAQLSLFNQRFLEA